MIWNTYSELSKLKRSKDKSRAERRIETGTHNRNRNRNRSQKRNQIKDAQAKTEKQLFNVKEITFKISKHIFFLSTIKV